MKKIYLFLLPLVITMATGCNNYGDKEIIILYTNDVHGAINYDEASGKVLSYANISQMKKDLKNKGKKVLLFDCGDHTSGGLYCSYLQGLPIVNIMSNAGYDAAIFGNHEFDHTFSSVEAYENLATFPYIATNLYHCTPEDQTPTTPYTNTSYVFDLGNIKVGVIGVSTPYSMVTSTPSYFQDDDGNFIYSFLDKNEGADLYNAVQKEVDKLHNEKECNYVICLSHMGNEELDTHTFAAAHLASHTTGIDVILDGHSHVTDIGTVVKNKNKEDVLITQTGSHFANIGKLTISPQGNFSNELVSTYEGRDKVVERLENNVIKHINEEFAEELATTDINFIAHVKDSSDWEVRRNETNLGDLSADAYYYSLNYVIEDEAANCDVTIVNGGSVRTDVPAKTWKLLDCRSVHMFDNNVAVKKMKGDVLKKYLEFTTRSCEDSQIGAFPQVQGITFTINTNIKSDIVIDDNGNYVSGPTQEHERISQLKIYNKSTNSYEDINLGNDYAVGGSAYILEDYGDGCTMFKDAESTYRNSTYVDYQVLAEYVKSFNRVNGLPVISNNTSKLHEIESGLIINYENETPGGGGRLTII